MASVLTELMSVRLQCTIPGQLQCWYVVVAVAIYMILDFPPRYSRSDICGILPQSGLLGHIHAPPI